jgi:predicted transcriptional regulator
MAANPQPEFQYVTPEELAVYRTDPPSSPHADFVVCLECGRKLALIATLHLRTHRLTSETYQEKWPDAPMVSKEQHDALSTYSKKHWDKIPPEQRTIDAKKRNGTPARKKAQSIAIRNVRAGKTGLTVEELEQWNTNAANAVRTPEKRQAASDRLTKRHAEQKAKLAAAWRPADWWQKPVDDRIVATELLAKDYMSNKELGRRLDSSRLLNCPYGQTWELALSGPGRAANYVTEVRKWVNRPGKRPV